MSDVREVRVYGVNHSPWVQAVLLGLHDKEIDYALSSLPPLDTFSKVGVLMPAASFDGGPWQLESADILERLGYRDISNEELAMVQRAWRGVAHRVDSVTAFWGGFARAGDQSKNPIVRTVRNFIRPFVTMYFFLLINFSRRFIMAPDPENFGDQFLELESKLASAGPFLEGEKPDTLDFLLFGIVQCHASIYVPPITAMQSDDRLPELRAWIGRMQVHFADYPYLYSGVYFAPHSPPPKWSSAFDRLVFFLGTLTVWVLAPLTISLAVLLAIRNLRK